MDGTSETSRQSHRIDCEVRGSEWSRWFLLSSDHHWDNPLCERDMLRRHLQQAKERDAGVFIFGDLFCFMQGKYDKRSDKSALREEHKHGNYVDTVIDTAVDWYGEFADRLVLISPGNHETSIRKKHETCPTSRLVQGLQSKYKSKVMQGDYTGWVRFAFSRGSARQSRWLHYHHGYGGGGPVTRGVIQTNRQAVYLPDADLVYNGHTHDIWQVPIARERINDAGRIYYDEQTHIRGGCYKNENKPGNGWHVERGGAPKPMGSWWLRWSWQHSPIDRPVLELTRAD